MSGHTAAAVQTAVVFVWLGMVLGISFLEAPLKFRAPGITIPLGVGIGRLVFRALNAVEATAAVVSIVALAAHWSESSTTAKVLTFVTVAVLAVGAGVLRPIMDRRVRAGELSTDGASRNEERAERATRPSGAGVPRNPTHLLYVGLEVVKVVVLVWLGIAVMP
ncbi:hypothetical protein [Tsukamurella soli]|uniref:Transmembrane protein n=1 Tax=Tsukamurella soli TaxID=644556 RepID=A0ABP8KDM0_9ACTN